MAFPTTGVLDAFNRADENPLSDGGKWSLGPVIFNAAFDDLLLASNTITAELGSPGNAYRNDQTYGPDTEVHALVPTALVDIRLYARLTTVGSGTTDGYNVRAVPAGAWQINRVDNAVDTSLGSTGDDLANGDSVGLETIGSTITGYRKRSGTWTNLLSFTDGTYTGAGHIAVRVGDNTVVLDDFGGGTIAVAPGEPGTTTLQQPGQGSRW